MNKIKFLLPPIFLLFGFCNCLSQVQDTAVARIKLDSVSLLIDSLKFEEAAVKADEVLQIYKIELGENHLLTARAYYKKGIATSKAGRREEALNYHKNALMIRKKLLENNHTEIANSLAKVGTTYYLLERFDSALFYQEKSLNIRLGVYGENHNLIAENYYSLGLVYMAIGDLNSGMEMFNKALDVQNAIYGDNINQINLTAEIYNGIGGVYNLKSEFKEATEYIKKSVKISENILPKNDPRIANKYGNIGLGYFRLGELDSALLYLKSSLFSKKAVLGENHKDVRIGHYFLGIIHYTKNEFNKAIDEFKKSEEIALRSMGENNLYLAQTYNGYGATYMKLAKNEKAIFYFEKGLEIFDELLPKNHRDRIDVIANLGTINFNMSKYELSLEYLFEAKNLLSQIGADESYHAATVLGNIGLNYLGMGRFEKALNYLDRSLYLKSKLLGETHPETSEVLSNIGIVYVYLNDPTNGISALRKALSITKINFGEQHETYIFSLQNLGSLFFHNNEPDSAMHYSQLALKLAMELNGKDHPNTALILNNIGMMYSKKNNYNLALDYSMRALKSFKQIYGNNHTEIAKTNYNMGICYKNLGQNALAIQHFQNTIKIEEEIFGKNHPESAESYYQIGEIYFNTKEFNLAKNYFANSLKCLDNTRTEFKNSNSKEIYYQRNYQIYEKMIGFAIKKFSADENHIQNTFVISEKAKANILLDAIHDSYAKYFSSIPDSLIIKERNLLEEIAYYEKKKNDLIFEKFKETDSLVYSTNQMLAKLRSASEELVNHLETTYPQYYQAKYDLSTVDVAYVQNQLLEEDQSLLEYLVGDSSIFLFLIQTDTFEIHEIKHDFPLAEWVQQLTKDGIYGYHTTPEAERTRRLQETTFVNYTEAAQQLYQKLIAPVAGRLTDNLIIIPDGVLGYVPFEALLTGKPNKIGRFSKYPFLVKDHQISYCYSATLLKEMRDKQHRVQPSGQLLSMAPFYDGDVSEITARIDTTDLLAEFNNRDSLGTLPGSGEEVAAINKLWKGKSIIGDGATLAEFQERAGDYRILHLSTHGKADDRVGDYAYLAFGVPGHRDEFDKLYARDLYNYSLNADLVVLSACETGTGKLQRGEGIVSLARAFAYAGAKSIFPTLWQVNDRKTKDLMIDFHKYLKSGKPKDEALRLAKLDFLKNNAGQGGYEHPFFWAGLIGIGDMRAIE